MDGTVGYPNWAYLWFMNVWYVRWFM